MLNNIENIREYHDLNDRNPKQKFVELQVFCASEKVRDWLGDTQVDEAESVLLSSAPDSAALRKANRMKHAEAELFMWFAIQKMNVYVTEQGIIKSTISQKFGTGEFTSANRMEIKAMRIVYMQTAKELVKKYMPAASGVLPQK